MRDYQFLCNVNYIFYLFPFTPCNLFTEQARTKNKAPYPGLVNVCAPIINMYIFLLQRGEMAGGWTTEKALTDFA